MPVRPVKNSLWYLIGLALLLAIIVLWADRLGPVGIKANKIGVIEINGVISRPDTIINNLHDLAKDNSVKGILIRIDSPGGLVAPAQEIHREIKKICEKKNVYTSIGSVAASGGYYIAAASDYIFASPGSTTGSIGVIMEIGNVEDLLQKIGLKLFAIKSGEFKDSGSPVRQMTEKEKALLQSVVDDMHDQFVTAIADGRHLPKSDVTKFADGRIFSGRKALSLGLVDELGNFRDAIDKLAEAVGISGEPELIYPGREEPGFLADLLRDTLTSSISTIDFNKPKYQFKP